ncbi:MAG: alpha-hydroxy acid oxidase [Pseudomonadota bacterium]
MPSFALEYLEGGAQDEITLEREQRVFDEWLFVPRQLRNVSERGLQAPILGREASMPLVVAPTGLNGIFRHRADILLAEGAARAGVPFAQSTMSNERLEDVAKVRGLRHWWQLYVFGGDEIWQELVARAEAAGCEALVLTTNAQIYGRREWDARTRASRHRPTARTVLDAALHPRWLAGALARSGMPSFKNVRDFVPKSQRGLFESAFWVRDHMRTSLSWTDVRKIRDRWKRPLLVKGLLHPDDVRSAADCGVDGVVLSTHGGRQLDGSVTALEVLPKAREAAGDRLAVMVSGGVRRGADMLKALALGADAVMAGRAPLYGLCAAGADGVHRALEILRAEALDDLGLLGIRRPDDLTPDVLVPAWASGPLRL